MSEEKIATPTPEEVKEEKIATPILSTEAEKLLGEYKLGEYLSEGEFAQVWTLVASNLSDRVLKIQTIDRKEEEEGSDRPLGTEIKMAIKAGEMGVGPLIHGTLLEPIDGDHYMQYIVQDRLSGPTVDDLLPLITPEIVISGLTLYHTLLSKGHIQGDLTASNLMYNKDRLYLIDYGFGNTSDEWEQWEAKDMETEFPRHCGAMREAMEGQVKRLLSSISGKFRRNKSSTPVTKEIRATLVKAAEEWMSKTFPP